MTVQELINELQKMPQDATVVIYDGEGKYTPYKIHLNALQEVVID